MANVQPPAYQPNERPRPGLAPGPARPYPASGPVIAVLGPLIAQRDGASPPLRRKARALLAYLAVTVRQHRRAALAALFCQDASDPAAALRLLLSRIRTQLGPTLLLLDGEHVALAATSCWVDLHVFEALLGPDPAAGSAEKLGAAVALYRGPLLDDVSLSDAPEFELWLLGERARLARRYSAALLRLLDLAEEAGDLDSAITYARALADASPLSEEAHGRLLRLYARAGQREVALAQFTHIQGLLRRELAAEPGPELIALHETLLAGGLPEAPRRPTPAALGAQPSTTLLEREAELARLDDLWAELDEGRGAIALIEGEAGCGKSRLLREFARGLPGGSLRLGACTELARAQPYGPWAELLELQLAPADLAALPHVWRDELLRLLPGHAGRLNLSPPPAPRSDGADLERIGSAVAEAVAPRDAPPLLIIIEDLHWADESSLRLFGYLARRLARRPVLLVGTLRPSEAAAHPALQTLLEELSRRDVVRLAPRPLSDRAVAELTARMWGDLPAAVRPAVAARIARATAGNPLYVIELLRELAADPRVPEQLPVPRGIRELVGRRLARLPPASGEVLELLAVLTVPATLAEACAVSGQDLDAGATALDAGLRWGLLTVEPGASTLVYSYSHDLTREAVAVQLSPPRRQILHGRVARHLDGATARLAPGARLALAGRLLSHALAADDDELVLRWAPLAAEQAIRLYAYPVALEQIDRALESSGRLGDRAADERAVFELLLRRLQLLISLGRSADEAATVLGRAEAWCDAHPEGQLRADLVYWRARLYDYQSRCRETIEPALEARVLYRQLGDRCAEAACLALAGDALLTLGANHRALVVCSQAIELYRDAGDQDGEAYCLSLLGLIAFNLGRPQEAIDRFEELLARTLAQQSLLGEARAHLMLALAWSSFYHPEHILAHAARARTIFETLQMPIMVARATLFLGAGSEAAGDLQRAETLYAAAWEQATQLSNDWIRGWAAQLLGRRAYWRGEIALAREWLTRAAAIREHNGEQSNLLSDLVWLARAALAQGDPQTALDLASRAVADMHASDEYYVWETPDVYLVHAEALAANGDRPGAVAAVARAGKALEHFTAQIRDPDERRRYADRQLARRIRAAIETMI